MVKQVALASAVAMLMTGCLSQVGSGTMDASLKGTQENGVEAELNVQTPYLPEDAVARVNGEVVLAVQEMRSLDKVIGLEVLAQKAKRDGLPEDKLKLIQAHVEHFERQYLAEAYSQSFASQLEVSEEDLKQRYNKLIEAQDPREYQFKFAKYDSHDEAVKAIEAIKAEDVALPEAFQRLKTGDGKEVTWASIEQLPPMFASVLPLLKKGGTHDEPLPSNKGYFVTYLEDQREKTFPELAEVKGSIEKAIRQEALAEHIKEIRGRSVIQIK